MRFGFELRRNCNLTISTSDVENCNLHFFVLTIKIVTYNFLRNPSVRGRDRIYTYIHILYFFCHIDLYIVKAYFIYRAFWCSWNIRPLQVMWLPSEKNAFFCCFNQKLREVEVESVDFLGGNFTLIYHGLWWNMILPTPCLGHRICRRC